MRRTFSDGISLIRSTLLLRWLFTTAVRSFFSSQAFFLEDAKYNSEKKLCYREKIAGTRQYQWYAVARHEARIKARARKQRSTTEAPNLPCDAYARQRRAKSSISKRKEGRKEPALGSIYRRRKRSRSRWRTLHWSRVCRDSSRIEGEKLPPSGAESFASRHTAAQSLAGRRALGCSAPPFAPRSPSSLSRTEAHEYRRWTRARDNAPLCSQTKTLVSPASRSVVVQEARAAAADYITAMRSVLWF